MARYTTPIDICNRALQHCRKERIVSFGDSSHAAKETGFAYDKLRQAELERNLWRFATKRVVLRPIDTVTAVLETNAQVASGTVLTFSSTSGVIVGQLVTGTNIASGTTVASIVVNTSVTFSIAVTGTVANGAAITFGPLSYLWTPPAYSAATTYLVGQVATYLGEWWQSKVTANLANTPDVGDYWARYSGPDTMQTWDTDTAYYPGELVLGSDAAVYMSLISATQDSHNPISTTGFWRIVNGTVVGLSLLYPIGTGPRSDTRTRNCFRLPKNFLKQAPSDPKGGGFGYVGAPTGNVHEDWVFEGNYIVSDCVGPLLLRYVADFVDVPGMTAQFCEMLAARIATEVAPVITEDQLALVLQVCQQHYRRERQEAVTSNAIEIGPIDRELDSYITVRF